MGIVPMATAADANSGTVASARAFPASKSTRHIAVGVESTSTDANGDWGDVESLNVPQTESQAEKDAAAAKAQAASEAAAASRSATRTAITEEAPVSGDASALVAYALQFQGAPYVWGGNTPAGWDCSGFTQYVFAHFGISLSHYAPNQASAGTIVTNPQPGDLMVSATHAGIYIGNGMMVHAMNPADGTKVTAVIPGMTYVRVLK
ncbi:C40 family peptidase [Bifidobacterium sp. LC6]|uniref:C40 family peptidase n=2 Tax=Bifidobacterium colobi TaxID=2809026 RepID=A0ABS5UU75_9BIFI|nr:C40 family peptidase [Bifidobacterium colobi]